MATLEQRLLRSRKIDPATGCWNWAAKTSDSQGRGLLTVLAHRIAMKLWNGTDDGIVMHKCDNPRCFNPEHLEIGTQKQNINDSVRRGRNVNSSKSHCPSGHLYTSENTYWYQGRRYCRPCHLMHCENFRKKKRKAVEL